jgi:hypothetical protein
MLLQDPMRGHPRINNQALTRSAKVVLDTMPRDKKDVQDIGTVKEKAVSWHSAAAFYHGAAPTVDMQKFNDDTEPDKAKRSLEPYIGDPFDTNSPSHNDERTSTEHPTRSGYPVSIRREQKELTRLSQSSADMAYEPWTQGVKSLPRHGENVQEPQVQTRHKLSSDPDKASLPSKVSRPDNPKQRVLNIWRHHEDEIAGAGGADKPSKTPSTSQQTRASPSTGTTKEDEDDASLCPKSLPRHRENVQEPQGQTRHKSSSDPDKARLPGKVSWPDNPKQRVPIKWRHHEDEIAGAGGADKPSKKDTTKEDQERSDASSPPKSRAGHGDAENPTIAGQDADTASSNPATLPDYGNNAQDPPVQSTSLDSTRPSRVSSHTGMHTARSSRFPLRQWGR